MKILTCALITLFSTFGSAHAFEEITLTPIEETAAAPSVNELEPVQTDRLKLVGRGVRSKDGASMALGCLDDSCSQARMVWFDADGLKAYYFGRIYQFTSNGEAPSAAQVKQALQKLQKDYRRWKRHSSMGRTAAFAVVGVGGVVGIALLTGSLPIFLGTLGAFALLHNRDYRTNIRLGGDSVIATFDSVKGWNWSSRPKRVSDKAFGALIYATNFKFAN